MKTMGSTQNSWLRHRQWTMENRLVVWEGQGQGLPLGSMPSTVSLLKEGLLGNCSQSLFLNSGPQCQDSTFETLRTISFGKLSIVCCERSLLYWGRLDSVMQTIQPLTRFIIFVIGLRMHCWDLAVSWATTLCLVSWRGIYRGSGWRVGGVSRCTKDDLNENEELKWTDTEW